MGYFPLTIGVLSATDLKYVNLFSKMDVYVVVTLNGDQQTKHQTPVDKDGGTNPTWNCLMNFNIDEAAAQQNRLILVFQIRCERSLGDKDVGEVRVPVKELLDHVGDGKSAQFVSYQVRKPSGKLKGVLKFSHEFGEKVTGMPATPTAAEPVTWYSTPTVTGASTTPIATEAVTGYPAPMGTGALSTPPGSNEGHFPPASAGFTHIQSGWYPPAAAAGNPQQGAVYGYPKPAAGYGYGYPPPLVGYGYGYPPPAVGYGYGHPPPAAGYGYGYPPAQQPPNTNQSGMGGATELIGGALRLFLIGDTLLDGAGSGV